MVSFTSKTQGSLSTSTAESEIKAVNQRLKEGALALRGMLNLMGFPQDATIIEEDNQACVYASGIPHMTRGMRHLDLAELLIKDKWMLRKSNFLKSFLHFGNNKTSTHNINGYIPDCRSMNRTFVYYIRSLSTILLTL